MLSKPRASVTHPGLTVTIGSAVVEFHFGAARMSYIVDTTGARLYHVSAPLPTEIRLHCTMFARALADAKIARVQAQAARINGVAV